MKSLGRRSSWGSGRSTSAGEGSEEGPEGWVAVFDNDAVALCGELGDLQRHVGKRVGILRTDDVERPMRVRMCEETGG